MWKSYRPGCARRCSLSRGLLVRSSFVHLPQNSHSRLTAKVSWICISVCRVWSASVTFFIVSRRSSVTKMVGSIFSNSMLSFCSWVMEKISLVSDLWLDALVRLLLTVYHSSTSANPACTLRVESTSVGEVAYVANVLGLTKIGFLKMLIRGWWSESTTTLSRPRIYCSKRWVANTIAKHSFSIWA